MGSPLLLITSRNDENSSASFGWLATLFAPVAPLVAWYTYHFRKTGFIFGNPEFLRYNATANLTLVRVLVSLWHRSFT